MHVGWPPHSTLGVCGTTQPRPPWDAMKEDIQMKKHFSFDEIVRLLT